MRERERERERERTIILLVHRRRLAGGSRVSPVG